MKHLDTKTQGQKLWHRLVERNIDHGGILGEVTGAMGTSKTGCLLFLADFIMQNRPFERIFFREQVNAPLQVFKIGEASKYTFFVKNDAEIAFRDRNKKLEIIEEFPYETFDTYEELWEKSKPGNVSVVFFKTDAEWMDFIDWLRNAGEWVNVLVDEMADIVPNGAGGTTYKRIEKFANTMGAVRRCMMNVMYNTQSIADVHWKVRHKAMFHVYFRGAKPDKRGGSSIKQKAINSLDVNEKKGNEAWIEMFGVYGKLRFSQIYRPNPDYHIEAYRPDFEET